MVNKYEDFSVVDRYLSASLGGSMGVTASAIKNKKENLSSDYRTKITHFYKIAIIYESTEENKIVFQTTGNPNEFFQNFSNVYHEK